MTTSEKKKLHPKEIKEKKDKKGNHIQFTVNLNKISRSTSKVWTSIGVLGEKNV